MVVRASQRRAVFVRSGKTVIKLYIILLDLLYSLLYNNSMEKQYRPYMGKPYEYVFQRIADKLNETSMNKFSDMTAARHCAFEMWKRMFPGEPFPNDADNLRVRYYADPEIVQSA